jgi:hypothetical protein
MKFALSMAGVAVLATMGANDAPQATDTYLRSTIGLSAGDVKHLRSGQVVATQLNGRDGREVVTFGAVRIAQTPDAVFEYLGHIDALRQGASVRQLGTLRSPPHTDDMAAFTLAPETVPGLHECDKGSCDVQLPGWAIARFQREVPWRTPGAEDAIHRVARGVALETYSAYLKGGHAALLPYEDRSQPTSASAEYARLLGSAEFLPAPLTAVRHFLNGYPHRPAVEVRDRFFWAVVDFGAKPTFRLSHMALASGRAIDDPSGQVTGAVATVQVLATHYFSSTLEWHFVVRDPDNPAASYLYYLSRSWAPGLIGIRGRLMRGTVRGRNRDAIEGYLRYSKQALEGGR